MGMSLTRAAAHLLQDWQAATSDWPSWKRLTRSGSLIKGRDIEIKSAWPCARTCSMCDSLRMPPTTISGTLPIAGRSVLAASEW